MYYRFTQYLRFLLSSTNEHGIHSPFVYQFITRCIYAKSNIKGTKTIRVLLKSIAYFQVKNVYLPSKSPTLKNTLQTISPQLKFTEKPYDLVYFKNCQADTLTQLILSNELHNDSMVLIDNIRQSRSNFEQWSKIIASDDIVVSIDMYYCGVLFLRKEQLKEHFKIRI